MPSLPLVKPSKPSKTVICPISSEPCPGQCVFADVLASVGVGIVLFNTAAERVVFVNASARALLERREGRMDYRSLHALLVPEGVDLRTFASPLAPEPLTIEQRLIGYTLYRANGHAWAFLRDVTEKARLESIAESIELMNSLGFVFSAVRHELGNPINSLKAALTVLRRGTDRFGKEALEAYLDRMLAEVGRVEHLLRSMKSFSMFERVDPMPMSLSTFLDEWTHLVHSEAERREISVRVSCGPDVSVVADPRALNQVLLNLFANAADALDGVEDAEIVIDASVADGLVRLRFSDNGVGLSADLRGNLFKPFYTSKEKGTGLGLVISRKLVSKMAGTITLEPRATGGAEAWLSLPAATSPAE